MLTGDVEILDVEAQDLVGASGGLVEQPPQGAFAQVDVAALPEPLEARERNAAGVVVLFGAALQLEIAVDVEDPSALAVGLPVVMEQERTLSRFCRAQRGSGSNRRGLLSGRQPCLWRGAGSGGRGSASPALAMTPMAPASDASRRMHGVRRRRSRSALWAGSKIEGRARRAEAEHGARCPRRRAWPEFEALAEANLYGFASATMGDVLVGSCHRVAVRLPYASIPS